MLPGTEKIPYLHLSTIVSNFEEPKSPRLKRISETDETMASISQNALISSPDSDSKKSPRLLKASESRRSSLSLNLNQGELKKSPRLEYISKNSEKPASERTLRRSLPQINAVKAKNTPRKRSSTLNDPSQHGIDALPVVKSKSLRRVKENQEILQRIHIRKEIIFAKNFLNTLENVPLFEKKIKPTTHLLSETFQTIHSSTEHFDYIVSLNMKAKKHNVYFCLDDNGEMVMFSELFESIKLKKSAEISRAEVNEILIDRRHKRSDLKYDDALNLSENESYCYNTLINFYHKGQEAIPPLQFLNMYEKFVTTARLLSLIALAIESPNVSFLKKMRIVNFIQTLHKFKMLECETPEALEALKCVIAACDKTKSTEIIQLCSEIEFTFNSPKLALKNHRTQCDANDQIIKILTGECGFHETEKFIEEITNDLKLISAFSVYNTTPGDLMNDINKYPASIFWNNLFSYIDSIYTGQIKEAQDPPEITAFKSNKFIELFTSIAYTLTQKNEYWASNAIYCILEHYNIPDESKKSDKTDKSSKNIKKRLSLSTASLPSFQKPKLTEKSDYIEISLRLEELKHLFSPLESYKNMRETMIECSIKQTFFVPHLLSHSLMALKELQHIDLNPDLQNNALKKSFEKSLIFSNLNTFLSDLRFQTENECKEKRLYTDIQKKIYQEETKNVVIPQIQIIKPLT